jgi:REP element-mobilizing transposase RayT
MVIGHHLIWTAYGWWLPNDPRGSMSHVINRDVLKDLGELHHGRKRVQPASRVIREFYQRADGLLQYPVMNFVPVEINTIARAFEETIRSEGYTCYACAIMPDHIHVLIRKHKDRAEDMIEKLQLASCRAVRDAHARDKFHPVWGGCGWKVFLDSVDDVKRTVRYVEGNPIKARLQAQAWEFVTPYDNWPFHKRKV